MLCLRWIFQWSINPHPLAMAHILQQQRYITCPETLSKLVDKTQLAFLSYTVFTAAQCFFWTVRRGSELWKSTRNKTENGLLSSACLNSWQQNQKVTGVAGTNCWTRRRTTINNSNAALDIIPCCMNNVAVRTLSCACSLNSLHVKQQSAVISQSCHYFYLSWLLATSVCHLLLSVSQNICIHTYTGTALNFNRVAISMQINNT